jgi:hypothetical protein
MEFDVPVFGVQRFAMGGAFAGGNRLSQTNSLFGMEFELVVRVVSLSGEVIEPRPSDEPKGEP